MSEAARLAMGGGLGGLALAWSGLALGLASPGPNQLAVIGTAMARGRRAGLALAAGIATGTGAWALVCVTGLAALVTGSEPAMGLLRLGAAAYLALLAWGAFRAARASAPPPVPSVVPRGGGVALWGRGLGVQATNLKAAVYWVALAGLGVGAGISRPMALLFVTGCALISGAGHAAYALAFSRPGAIAAYDRLRPRIQGALCAVLGLASLALLAGA